MQYYNNLICYHVTTDFHIFDLWSLKVGRKEKSLYLGYIYFGNKNGNMVTNFEKVNRLLSFSCYHAVTTCYHSLPR